MQFETRVAVHAALGDPNRLRIADALVLGDRSVQDLAAFTGLKGNALAHHLNVLELAGVIERRVSAGDHRHRYVVLRAQSLTELSSTPEVSARNVLFICTHNSARSQFAAAMWRHRTGRRADSAGTDPVGEVNPGAIREASRYGLDLDGLTPKGYDSVPSDPDLVVSVCDRALESGVPFAARRIHWSVPDPVENGTPSAFRRAFAEIAERVGVLAMAAGAE